MENRETIAIPTGELLDMRSHANKIFNAVASLQNLNERNPQSVSTINPHVVALVEEIYDALNTFTYTHQPNLVSLFSRPLFVDVPAELFLQAAGLQELSVIVPRDIPQPQIGRSPEGIITELVINNQNSSDEELLDLLSRQDSAALIHASANPNHYRQAHDDFEGATKTLREEGGKLGAIVLRIRTRDQDVMRTHALQDMIKEHLGGLPTEEGGMATRRAASTLNDMSAFEHDADSGRLTGVGSRQLRDFILMAEKIVLAMSDTTSELYPKYLDGAKRYIGELSDLAKSMKITIASPSERGA